MQKQQNNEVSNSVRPDLKRTGKNLKEYNFKKLKNKTEINTEKHEFDCDFVQKLPRLIKNACRTISSMKIFFINFHNFMDQNNSMKIAWWAFFSKKWKFWHI